MKKVLSKTKRMMVGMMAIAFFGLAMAAPNVLAADDANKYGFSLSPMSEKIILKPGETYENTLKVTNPSQNVTNIEYEVSVEPFYVDEKYEMKFENVEDRTQMANWITIVSKDHGTLAPNETANIVFRINVPKDAVGGGQYATILVSSSSYDKSQGESAIKDVRRIGHLVYAEITGDVVRNGEIIDASVPSFLLSGNITGVSSIKNTGNVHSEATYKLQVFPLFSDEEIYTNEENPITKTILPDRTLYNEIEWDKTPGIGIFNVVYTVEFEGTTAQVSKMVIICPIWLLLIILFCLALIVIWLVRRASGRRKKATREE